MGTNFVLASSTLSAQGARERGSAGLVDDTDGGGAVTCITLPVTPTAATEGRSVPPPPPALD